MSSEENFLDNLSEGQEDAELFKDLRLEMKIKNNILWNKIHEKFPSVAAFCRANKELGMTPTSVGRLLAFKTSPFIRRRIKGEQRSVKGYSKLCLALETVLNYPAEVLFPEELYQKFVGTQTSKTIEINSFSALPAPEKQKILFLPAPDPSPISEAELQELKERFDEVLKTLRYRECEIIKLRYGLGDGYTYSLEEVGRIFKLTKERVRQIETKAIGKLREYAIANRLRNFV